MKEFSKALWGVILVIGYFFSGFLFGGKHVWMSVSMGLITFVLSVIYFRKTPKQYFKGLLVVVGPMFLLLTLVVLFGGRIELIIGYMFFMPVYNYLAWIFVVNNRYLKALTALFLVIGFASFLYFPNQLNYFFNRNSRTDVVFPKIDFINAEKVPVKLGNHKVIVLDFWTTSCAVCFEKFPDFEKLYLKFKNNPKIKFYSVNVPLKRDSLYKTEKLVKKLGYKFPTIYLTSREKTEKKLNIDGYPYFVIIKNNRIRFEGYLNIDNNVFIYNTIDEIDRLIAN